MEQLLAGEYKAAWATLHPDLQRLTDVAAFVECQRGRQQADPKPEVRAQEAEEVHDPEIWGGHVIAGPASRVPVEFHWSAAGAEAKDHILVFKVDGDWRWADQRLDLVRCEVGPLD
jgi:hypothetical protein